MISSFKTARRARDLSQLLISSTLFCGIAGCGHLSPPAVPASPPVEVCASDDSVVEAEQARLFRKAETARASALTREIERLQLDLRTAEAALVEAESGLSRTHSRADAVSSLAETRIQLDRAASRAPWRSREIDGAREKLEEAERQVAEGRFGAALFFVYRARRVADAVLDEAARVVEEGNARLIRGRRVNLRAGPSTSLPILAVLDSGTPVFLQADEGDWVLVQVSGGPAGWIHRGLLGQRVEPDDLGPAAPLP